MKKELVLILDFGQQHNQLIARCVRDQNVYCEVRPCSLGAEEIKAINPKGVIFIGGSPCACNESAECGGGVLNIGVPVLSLCCGKYSIQNAAGKGVGEGPFNMEEIKAEQGQKILHGFLYDICGCAGEWTMNNYAKEQIALLREKIGGKKVLCAMSGGVDSSVSAVLVHKAVGKQLTCVFVDHGLMRKNEGDEVARVFRDEFDMNLIRVDAQERFLEKLKGVTDPEQKRKIIGEEFIHVFEEEAKKIGSVDYLVQGTIYPDIIESGTGGRGAVKSHHNVGGLPDVIDFREIIEPLRYLFKDEVRKVGLALGIPEKLVWRQPFPGPGLGVRVIGEVTKEKLDILREADAIFREEVINAGLGNSINQYFAILTGMRSVGVTDNERTYDYTVALRAVSTVDFMTADWVKMPYELLERVSERIVAEVPCVNRVVYDITRKPPSTIEWE